MGFIGWVCRGIWQLQRVRRYKQQPLNL